MITFYYKRCDKVKKCDKILLHLFFFRFRVKHKMYSVHSVLYFLLFLLFLLWIYFWVIKKLQKFNFETLQIRNIILIRQNYEHF